MPRHDRLLQDKASIELTTVPELDTENIAAGTESFRAQVVDPLTVGVTEEQAIVVGATLIDIDRFEIQWLAGPHEADDSWRRDITRCQNMLSKAQGQF